MQNANNSQVLSILVNASTDSMFIQKRLNNETVANTCAALCSEAQAQAMNQKARKRFVQAVSFAVRGNNDDFDAVSALVVSSLVLAKGDKVHFSQLHALAGLHKEGVENDAIKGVSKSKLNKFLGLGGTAGTITSKVSRSVGKGGLLTALGLVVKSDKHSVTIDRKAVDASPFVLAYAVRLSNMTAGQFELITSK